MHGSSVFPYSFPDPENLDCHQANRNGITFLSLPQCPSSLSPFSLFKAVENLQPRTSSIKKINIHGACKGLVEMSFHLSRNSHKSKRDFAECWNM